MIEMDESELSDSDFTDDSLRAVAALCGPMVAQALLLPAAVPVAIPPPCTTTP